MAELWTGNEVRRWLRERIHPSDQYWSQFCGIDGVELLAITDRDLYAEPFPLLPLNVRLRFRLELKKLQRQNRAAMIELALEPELPEPTSAAVCSCDPDEDPDCEGEPRDPRLVADAADVRASKLKPEIWKAFLSLCYVFAVTWVTAVVMVIVHDKVPDMKKYPPLPDLFLDNVPHIPWAFDMCEITGSILLALWVVVLLFHKHRFILVRRFFALSGTVFLLRCITMLITSLSVPGGHLKCAPRHYPSDAELYSNWSRRFNQAYAIWTGAGMSVRGVRTCGDYMFSGHTVALTLLNFFITEYTSRRLYLLHIVTWLMNMFGIFFILAAHEHYSIDVFIAFYITSRLFLYYHTLSNNQALMQGDSFRTRIWFPLLSFFESEVDGIVPNEYENPLKIFVYIKNVIYNAFHDLSETPLVKFMGNSLNQQAAMVDFSAARVLDNFKRNLNSSDLTGAAVNKSTSTPSMDKDVQTTFTTDNSCRLRQQYATHCCRHSTKPSSACNAKKHN